MSALSEINTIPDGMSVAQQVGEVYVCVVNRWPVVYLLLALFGLIGLVGCYYILSMKSRLIDIGPKSLLALETTDETQQLLRSTEVLGETTFNNYKIRIINTDNQNVIWPTLSFTREELILKERSTDSFVQATEQ